MTDQKQWYLPGPSEEGTGPLSAEDVRLRLKGHAITEQTLCWREGMSDWARLEETEPFATEVRDRRARRRRATLRIASVLAVPAGAIVVGYALWQHAKEPAAIREAWTLLDAGQPQAAIATLEGFLKQHPEESRALEPLGIALLTQYAMAPYRPTLVGGSDPRNDPQVQTALEHILRARARGVQDNHDLAERLPKIAASVPASAPDRLVRLTAVAHVREKLKMTAPDALVDEVMQAALSMPPVQLRRPENEPVWQSLLASRPSAADDVFLLLVGSGSLQGAEVEQVLALLAPSASASPEVAQQLGVTALETAQRLRTSNAGAALAALTGAIELTPELAQREDVAALSLELSPPASADRLARCIDFLARFPRSERGPQMQMLLLDDAVAFFGTYAWERDRAIPYLKAAEAAAASLLASHAALPGLVERVLALAECVVQASEHGYGEREDALQRGIALLDLLLAALPSTPRRLEIAQTKEGWRRELHPPEPSQDPVRPAGGAPRDPAIEKAQEICRSLLTRRLDTALLAELASISQGMTDRSYQGRCLAICYLGYRLAGRQAEAQQALLQMGQIPGATPLELASLLRPCNNCNGRAQIFASCAACNGRGRQSCTQCGGRGQLPRRFGGTPSICPVCSGQGYSSCPICSATGRIAQPCRACGGRGQQGSNEEMGRLYGTYLTGAAP